MQWTATKDGNGSKEAYDLIVNGTGTTTTDIVDAMKESYDARSN